jgi:hypothetical protein
VLALTAVLAAAIGGTAAAKPSASKAQFGQTVKKAMWGPTAHNGVSMFPTYKDLGIGIYQTQIHWNQVAPTKPANPTDPNDPAYKWPGGLTETIAEAAQNGMQVQLMIISTPTWANGGQPIRFAPDNPADYGDFATAVSKKYPSVRLFMIWGEPNRAPNFQPLVPAKNRTTMTLTKAQQTGPRKYAQLVDAAYASLKAVNPANKVIAGNTFTSAGPGAIYPYQWIKYMKLPGGKRPRMDMWGHNPYGFKLPSLKGPASPRGQVQFGDLKRLMKALDKAFRPKKLPLYLSEWGVPTGFEDLDLLYVLPVGQANKWIRAAYKIARTQRRIFTLGWVHPIDTERSSQGLLTTGFQRKPVYNTFKAS